MDTAAATYHIHFKHLPSKIYKNIFHGDAHAQHQSNIWRTVTIISLVCIYKCQHVPIQAPFKIIYFLHHKNLSSINSTALLIPLISCCIKTQYREFMMKDVLKDLKAPTRIHVSCPMYYKIEGSKHSSHAKCPLVVPSRSTQRDLKHYKCFGSLLF